ncbi:hypothetical protein OH76DRAFT_1409841 [Lentinus brumalis]|uniref:Uncharacterized protein n=1 Tax=Lentinus brumalis TaxID=2498619 RepID=A0A371CU15_9APHY|nr:hypothetical protein OH76DRAFT_1409841 [Polyporus brumalis]
MHYSLLGLHRDAHCVYTLPARFPPSPNSYVAHLDVQPSPILARAPIPDSSAHLQLHPHAVA